MRTSHILSAIFAGALLLLPGMAQAQQGPPPRLTPAETKRAWHENRRILIEVTTDSAFDPVQKGLRPGAPATFPFGEHFGIRIGNVVPLRIRVYSRLPEADNQIPIQIDFTALKNGRFSIDPMDDPDFVLANPEVLPEGEVPVTIGEPKVVELKLGDKTYPAELREIRLYVQTFRMPQPMLFSLEFSYAAQPLGEGGLDWKRITTPDYVLSMSRTADDGQDLSTGNTALVDQRPPLVVGIFLLVLGTIWVVTPAAVYILRYARSHFMAEKNLDPEERAWLVLDPLFKKCRTERGYAFSERQVQTVVAVILDYIDKPALDSSQLDSLRYMDDDGALVIRILDPLLKGILEEGRINDFKNDAGEKRFAQLVEYIEQLIKRP